MTGGAADDEGLGERGRRSVLQFPRFVVGLGGHGAARLESEAQALLAAEGGEKRHVDVVDAVALDDARVVRSVVLQLCPHLVQAVAVIDGLEDRRVGAPGGL